MKTILIAPLDWGLGHTTRCVPLISHIQRQGHIPVVAGNKGQAAFIKASFRNIDIIHLEGYNIKYSGWNKWAQIGLLSQVPGIQKAIAREHEWIARLCLTQQIDGIISDNRYGLFHKDIPSAIITHQLQVQAGLGNVADRLVRKIHYRYLNRFGETWVADAPGVPNLGGLLSHPAHMPVHAKYIGLLSRFHGALFPCRDEERHGAAPVLVLLSGPEPQRSQLSAILWRQALQHKSRMVFIEGSDTAIAPAYIPPHITYHKRLTAGSLAPMLHSARMVVCRSGYSTLMDLVALNKKAIVIPTPAQTEQLYLGKNLHSQGIFYCASQKGFDLDKALSAAAHFPFNPIPLHAGYGMYKNVLDEWLLRL